MVLGIVRGMLVALVVVLGPGVAAAVRGSAGATGDEDSTEVAEARPVRILALGDINLGRRLGQLLLAGDTLMPFQRVADTLGRYDIVFANLESNISDQHGRTESPSSNLIFTAPPLAARVLKRAGITVVSTANNHALDFGVKAADQTRALLDEAGIAYCGTAATPESLYTPANLTLRGIRFAFFAVTAVMNAPGDSWKSRVASADSAILYPAIRRARETHDYVVVSFHGGDEYADSPTRGVRRFVEQTLAAGADLVIGHHPHVPYGIYSAGDKLGAYSLGNFVFKQPSRFWTQRGLALSVEVSREKSGVRTSAWHCLPVRVDFQPEFCPLGAERDTVLKRVGLFFPSEAARTYDR